MGIEWIDLAQAKNKYSALVNAVMNLRISIKCLEAPEWLHN